MKKLTPLTWVITSLILTLLISGCVRKVYVHNECPTIEPVAKIERVSLHTDANSQLTQKSSYDAITMLNKHRIKENYNDTEIARLKEKVNNLKKDDK